MELQDQTNAYVKDLRIARSRLANYQKDSRVNQVTANHIQSLESNIPLYKSVGKTFIYTERQVIEKQLDDEIGQLTKSQRDCIDRIEYLERRIGSNTENLKDLTNGL